VIDYLRSPPVPGKLTRRFWDMAKEHRLGIQRCRACLTYFHPPVVICYQCDSRDLEFVAVTGRGTIYSFTWVHGSQLVATEQHDGTRLNFPFAVVQVELEEQAGLLLLANMADTKRTDIVIGAAVEVEFVEFAGGSVLPDFKLVTTGY
jgi:uncharacterized protein